MIPNIASSAETEDAYESELEDGAELASEGVIYPSLTYAIDWASQTIHGMTDGEPAIEQAITKILSTERFRYDIYSDQYGARLASLFGKPLPYAMSEVKSRITEALTADDRISAVTNFTVSRASRDALYVTFEVITTDGEILEEEAEVEI